MLHTSFLTVCSPTSTGAVKMSAASANVHVSGVNVTQSQDGILTVVRLLVVGYCVFTCVEISL